MPELSSEDTENNHEYSLIFFTSSYLEKEGKKCRLLLQWLKERKGKTERKEKLAWKFLQEHSPGYALVKLSLTMA